MTLDYTQTPDAQLWSLLEVISRQPRNPEIVAVQRAISAELADRSASGNHVVALDAQAAIDERLAQIADLN